MQSAGSKTPLIKRHSLREDVGRVLREWIIEGRLEGGERLEEARLTAELGVSRTPLREALLALECAGLVRSEVNKGFTVVPFDSRVVSEVYPIVGALEALAVRMAGESLKAVCPELRQINQKIRKGSRSPAVLYRLDLRWHELLWEGCTNPLLVSLTKTHKQHVRRFDGAFKRGVANVADSCREHAGIIRAIEAGDYDGASRKLDAHWQAGMQVVLRWLEKQRTPRT